MSIKRTSSRRSSSLPSSIYYIWYRLLFSCPPSLLDPCSYTCRVCLTDCASSHLISSLSSVESLPHRRSWRTSWTRRASDILDFHEPQILEEIADRVQVTTGARAEFIRWTSSWTRPFTQPQEEIFEVIQLYPPERISERIVEQTSTAAVLAGSSSSSHPEAWNAFLACIPVRSCLAVHGIFRFVPDLPNFLDFLGVTECPAHPAHIRAERSSYGSSRPSSDKSSELSAHQMAHPGHLRTHPPCGAPL